MEVAKVVEEEVEEEESVMKEMEWN